MAEAQSQEYLQAKRSFAEFLEQDEQNGIYAQKIAKMLGADETRLIINLNDLRSFQEQLAREFLMYPIRFVPAFEEALKEYVRDHYPQDKHASPKRVYHLGFSGSFGAHRVNPRTLVASLLGKMVCVEGIVTKCSLVRPKVVTSVHYCPASKAMSVMEYRDATSLEGAPTSSIYPTKDKDGNVLETEYGLSVYKDHQIISIQEMPEKAPPGQLPRAVEIILDDELVDRVKPGDRIQVAGIYRALAGRVSGVISGAFRTAVVANNVHHLAKDVAKLTLSDKDMENILSISKRPDVFELLGRSVAPSIYGHYLVKKAIILVLVGGVEKNLDNGGHIRGDLNMLMVGDPSTAKSQLLRAIMNLGPLVINTTGRGSSGAGLTAAVVTDRETGDRRLEAGAMVLADRGIVCIDEFDKMNEVDRVAIHEVMEQQTVTIAKAGIHTSLNARCSVIAAANPIYGQYDTSTPPAKNIGLPDSLLSRFDFLFLVLDQKDAEIDRAIADHVVRMHRYRKPNADNERMEIEDDADKAEVAETAVFEKIDRLLHSGAFYNGPGGAPIDGAANGVKELLCVPFVQKFVQYCKTAVRPQLTEKAVEYISEKYANLRKSQTDRSLPVTARSLETLIRIATAHAKLRLQKYVNEEDCVVAYEMLTEALFHDAPAAKDSDDSNDKRNSRDGGNSESDSNDSDDDRGGSAKRHRPPIVTAPKQRGPAASTVSPKRPATKPASQETPTRRSARAAAAGVDPYDFDQGEDDVAPMVRSMTKGRTPTARAAEPEPEAAEEPAEEPEVRSPSSRSKRAVRDDETAASPPTSAKRTKRAIGLSPSAGAVAPDVESIQISDERKLAFAKRLTRWFRSQRVENAPVAEAEVAVNANNDEPFTSAEIDVLLQALEADNKVMVRSGVITLIAS